jgi:hypothetical protein
MVDGFVQTGQVNIHISVIIAEGGSAVKANGSTQHLVGIAYKTTYRPAVVGPDVIVLHQGGFSVLGFPVGVYHVLSAFSVHVDAMIWCLARLDTDANTRVLGIHWW